ncbi:calcium-binding protein [Pararhizobium arenae]|uniref:calcium-binding protein n=1 Tax=Pararhizobium arenae TaxID=1856850 RepID=UPI00094AF892|nr:calcium-binding protein [Pararhizobium arenae]
MALTGLTKIDRNDFISKAAAFLKTWENAGLIGKTTASLAGAMHDDSRQNPTVGYGLNLKAMTYTEIDKAYRLALTGKTDGKLSKLQESGLDIIEAWKKDKTPTTAEDVTLINTSQGKAGTTAEKKALQSLWLTDTQASRLLEAKLKGYSGLFSSIEQGMIAALAKNHVSPPAASQERLALLSLYYNSPSLIGPGISRAIETDNHAHFWYEIRYNHANYASRGLQNRREAESNKVGILAPGDRKDVADVLKAMDFLFDRTGGMTSVYEKIAARDKIILTSELDNTSKTTESIAEARKQTFEAQISSYMKLLADTYAEGNALHFVQVGGSGNDTFTAGVASYSALDSRTWRNESNTNDLVMAGDGNNSVKTGGGNDWVFTGKGKDKIDLGDGNDHVSAGAGEDVINGGKGADIMDGGMGYDTYVIDNTGDRVIDSDRGKIRTEISLKSLTKNIDSYTNLKSGLTHTLKIDEAKLPAGGDSITFEGSSGNDTYRFSLGDDDLTLTFKTGAGSDRIVLTARQNPDVGLTMIIVNDATSTDRFDLTAFDALSFDAFKGKAADAGHFYYKLTSQNGAGTMALYYADDNADGTVTLHQSVSISSSHGLTDGMFIV